MSDRPIIGVTVGTGFNKDELKNKVTSVNEQTGDVKLTAKDVGALSQGELQSGVNLALHTAKESGDFKGEKGDPFKYEDFTPEQLEALKGEKGDPFTYADFTSEQLDSLKGENGKSGVYVGTEEPTDEGDTVWINPEGIVANPDDFGLTEEDKAEIVEDVLAKIEIPEIRENPYLGTLLTELSVPADTVAGAQFNLGITMGDLRKYKEIYVLWRHASNSGAVQNHYIRVSDMRYPILRWGGAGAAWLIKRGEFENPDIFTIYTSAGNPSTACLPLSASGYIAAPTQMGNMTLFPQRIDVSNCPDNELFLEFGTTNASVSAVLSIYGLKEM